MGRVLKTILACIGLATAAVASASILDRGITTQDTQTGYAWLDVTETTYCSYATLSSGEGFCNDVDLSKWTLASLNDVYEFWEHAGIGIQNSLAYTVTYASETWELQKLVGFNYDDGGFGCSNGAIASYTGFVQLCSNVYQGQVWSRDWLALGYAFPPFPTIGAWLYQAPEPGTLALLGLGLAGLGLSRRRKAH